MLQITYTFYILLHLIFLSNSTCHSNENPTRSFICLLQIPHSFLNSPMQQKLTTLTIETVLTKYNIKSLYGLFMVDIIEFAYYSITFKTDTVFRYTMDNLTTTEIFESLIEESTIVELYENTNTKKFLFTGSEFDIFNNFYEQSLANSHKKSQVTRNYKFNLWLDIDNPDYQSFEREMKVVTKQSIKRNLGEIRAYYNETLCSNYNKKAFLEHKLKIEDKLNTNRNEGVNVFIYQPHFENTFKDIKEFFGFDINLFFDELKELQYDEFLIERETDKNIGAKDVPKFTSGYVKVKNNRNTKYCVLVGDIISVLVVGGIIMSVMIK
eukprot:GAHX01002647.1.p1 GENE.GAHX01002647.1~~GAHX01002647.1.p1  ORF type:complete len:324 (+),score=58.03 GAHX01002647.1:189-1160(+)